MEKEMVISLDSALIDEAERVLDRIGLEFQNVVKILLKRIVNEQSVTFLLADNASPKVTQTKEVFSSAEKISEPIVQDVKYDAYREDRKIKDVKYDANTEFYMEPEVKGDMTKNKAIQLFRNEGIRFNRAITFASKNRGAYNYWANPDFEILNDDWYIILNDWLNRKLYLFFAPANSINASCLTPRSDKINVIDLQIIYGDKTFTDSRSNFSFAKFLVSQKSY